MDVGLALKISKLVHNECKDVPDDIGIRIEELVRLHQSELKNSSMPAVINCVAAPEWLTDEIRVLANTTWNNHKGTNDGNRVEAMRIVQRGASAAGYTIGIKKAMELLQQHCL